MQHLVFSCLESRVEDNGALFGRYLLGPLRVGQATTIATALRRALLSEVRGLAITAVEIRGASHQYSSIKGIRESALDIILNLKQVVLSGNITHDLPAVGYLDVQGPKAVTANDLRLPNGICCVNTHHPIATLSTNGLLKMKFVISAGKNRLTPYTDSAHTISEDVFQPKTRSVEKKELPLYQRKSVRQELNKPFERQKQVASLYLQSDKSKEFSFIPQEKRVTLFHSSLHKTLWSQVESLLLYSKKRRSNNLQKIEDNLNRSSVDLSQHSDFEKFVPVKRLTAQKDARNQLLERLSQSKKVNFLPLKDKQTSAEASKRFNTQLGNLKLATAIADTNKSLFLKKAIEKFEPNQLPKKDNSGGFRPGGIPDQETKTSQIERDSSSSESPRDLMWRDLDNGQPANTSKEFPLRSILPVNPTFTPISKVNFAIQIDDQWQEARERIILEVWSNGSINPRQAIREAATNLVYVFSLLR